MNVRCNCGHYYNTDVYDNVCPECEQTYNVNKEHRNNGIDIDKHFKSLAKMFESRKRSKNGTL